MTKIIFKKFEKSDILVLKSIYNSDIRKSIKQYSPPLKFDQIMDMTNVHLLTIVFDNQRIGVLSIKNNKLFICLRYDYMSYNSYIDIILELIKLKKFNSQKIQFMNVKKEEIKRDDTIRNKFKKIFNYLA